MSAPRIHAEEIISEPELRKLIPENITADFYSADDSASMEFNGAGTAMMVDVDAQRTHGKWSVTIESFCRAALSVEELSEYISLLQAAQKVAHELKTQLRLAGEEVAD